MEVIETKKVNGYTIEIYRDEDARSPREDCGFGTMLCSHRRYVLGDVQIKCQDDLNKILKRKDVKYLPLYLYDHSGITMSTTPFSCPWDSGQVGIIYATHEDICKEFGPKGRALVHISKRAVSSAFKLMRQEVKVYDAFLKGEVYGYEVKDPDGEVIDSCWGFICPDNLDYIIQEARNAIPQLSLPLDLEVA